MAIFEMRTYTMRPGVVADYLAFYDREGRAIHCGHLGDPVAWWFTEVGPLNQVIMVWRYENHADREARRERLAADPAWTAFAAKTGAYITTMENKILRPAFFSPLQ